jgi:2,4-dienoyl-CoA reductase-like NADH-dependent reductase (Old Yellow Enzyme family)
VFSKYDTIEPRMKRGGIQIMSGLFETTSLRNMTLSNRFVRSATWEGLATPEGEVTPRLIDVQTQLARGGVGLIISGHAFVSQEGRAGRWQLAGYSDEFIPGLAAMAKAIHDAAGKIALQIAHAGTWGAFQLTGLEPVGASTMPTESGPVGRGMNAAEIRNMTAAFVNAAARAKAAGFDAVQIHAAHGYMFSQFLSPHFNKREDEYGGSIENRTRFLADTVEAVRKEVGPEFPILIKMNAEDFLPDGLTAEDMITAASILERAGIDAIEMSGGTFFSGKNTPTRVGKPAPGEPEAYYESQAAGYKRKISAPLMMVGGIRTLETAERLVASGICDYIAMSRPFIREPALVSRWKSGDRRPALCVSDSGCFAPGFAGKGVYCVVDERERARTGKVD